MPQKPNLWQRFRRLSQGWQLGIALSTAAVLLICGCCSCSTFASALNGGNATAQSTSTATTATGSGSIAQATTPQQDATAAATAAATATPKPKPTATPKPKATSTPKPSCPYPAVSGNPWCYTFTNTGKVIYNPPGSFCGYFDCISSFWNGSGYVVECQDDTYSKSGGHTGSCSRHGGDKRPLYAP